MSDQNLSEGAKGRNLFVGLMIALQFVWFILILLVWNTSPAANKPDLNILAVSITAVQIVLGALTIMLGVGAFFGFWMIKESAIAAAQREARNVINEKAAEMFGQVAKARGETEEPRVGEIDEAAILDDATELTEDNNAGNAGEAENRQ